MCGKKGVKGLCDECKAKKEPLVTIVKDIQVKICVECKKYFLRNKWIKYDSLSSAITAVAKDKIKTNKKSKLKIKPLIDIKPGPGVKKSFELEIIASDGVQKEIYVVPADIEFTYCPKCSKHENYYEGTLQLRNSHEEVIRYIRNEVKNNKEKGVFIAKEAPLKNGVDFYISKQHFIQTIAKRVHKKFGGKTTINPKLFTRDQQRSRDIYRMNVLIELPVFTKGDVVKVAEKIINIKKMGKTITGEDIITRKSFSFSPSQAKVEKLETKEGSVSKTYPDIEIIEPDSYQSVKVENKKDVKTNKKVKFVDVKGKIYII